MNNMRPTLEEAKKMAASGDYRRIPVSCEIPTDGITPSDVMKRLRYVSRHCFLLESAEDNQKWGRYTFLGYDPEVEITCQDGQMRIASNTEQLQQVQHPGDVIRKILAENKSPRIPGQPSFTGGLVGYFSYDYIKYAEPVLNFGQEGAEDFKDVDMMLFDKVIAFDRKEDKIVLICGAKTGDLDTAYHKAEMELAMMAELVTGGRQAEFVPISLEEELKPRFSKERYCDMVRKAQHYIHEGDIFQVVLSNPLEAKAAGNLFGTYEVLRRTNPSPYMFYFASDSIELAGASPETLVKLEGDTLHTFPLAGTRKRGATPQEDEELERGLLKDEKELAEHNMLVDLGRNDIGKVSTIGSVRVEDYMQVLRFSHVMHIGSTVAGTIRPDLDAVDAMDSILPAGTLSGAPKIRACQIIHELEGGNRGVYGGAIGYLDFAGNMDTCIAIRLAYKRGDKVYVRSGAGIVADSVPESEFEECINKAKAVVQALPQGKED